LLKTKTIALLILFTASNYCFAGGDTNIIAMGDWSKPVGSVGGPLLRGRLLITQEHDPGYMDTFEATHLYLELENVSDPSAGPVKLYFDPINQLHCELSDANGKPPPEGRGGGFGGDGGGDGVAANWITLPYDSTVRLRANGRNGWEQGDGLLLVIAVPNQQFWRIWPGDTNTYFFSGTFTVRAGTNSTLSGNVPDGTEWHGKLEFPKMRISVQN
jgi:hypothetical protein